MQDSNTTNTVRTQEHITTNDFIMEEESEHDTDPILDRNQILNQNKHQIRRISSQISIFNLIEIFQIIIEIIYMVFYVDYLIILAILMATANIIIGITLPRNQYLLVTFTLSMSRLGIMCYLVLCIVVDIINVGSINSSTFNTSFIMTQILRALISVIMITQFICSIVILKSISAFQEAQLPHMPLPGQELQILQCISQQKTLQVNNNLFIALYNQIGISVNDIQQLCNIEQIQDFYIKYNMKSKNQDVLLCEDQYQEENIDSNQYSKQEECYQKQLYANYSDQEQNQQVQFLDNNQQYDIKQNKQQDNYEQDQNEDYLSVKSQSQQCSQNQRKDDIQ